MMTECTVKSGGIAEYKQVGFPFPQYIIYTF